MSRSPSRGRGDSGGDSSDPDRYYDEDNRYDGETLEEGVEGEEGDEEPDSDDGGGVGEPEAGSSGPSGFSLRVGRLPSPMEMRELLRELEPGRFRDHVHAIQHRTGMKSMFLNDLLTTPSRKDRKGFVNTLKAFCFFLQDDPYLGNLFLYGNRMNDRMMAILCDAIRENSSLRSIDVSKNKIRDAGSAFLSSAMKVNSTITSLTLSFNDMAAATGAQMGVLLQHNRSVTFLDISSNLIQPEGGAGLALGLKRNRHLKTLCLNSAEIGATGAAAIFKALHTNTTLTTLMMGSNKIEDGDERAVAMEALADLIQVNSTLTHLHLQDNPIGNLGATVLSKGFLTWTGPLQLLDLRWTSIRGPGIRAIWRALKENENKADDDITILGIPGRSDASI